VKRCARVIPIPLPVHHRIATRAGDSTDLTPWGFDRDLRLHLFGCEQIGEQREANAGPMARAFIVDGVS
jgi:hypothetical protein